MNSINWSDVVMGVLAGIACAALAVYVGWWLAAAILNHLEAKMTAKDDAARKEKP
jgi:high-affinity Fe2+/Pb2+ permease